MNCATHNSVAAVAYCRTCGKPLCAACARDVRGTIFCEHCLAERVAGALPPTPVGGPTETGTSAARPYAPSRLPSPGMAAVLGFIPGVGAMYNGQFMKGFIHVMAFVTMIWMADRFGPIMVPVFFAYFFYLVFDAYKTAHALELGQPVPDPFGFEKMFGPTPQPGAAPFVAASASAETTGVPAPDIRHRNNVPTGAVVLIVLGLLFLLHTVGLFEFGIDRFWPVILIALGGWLFAKRWGLVGSSEGVCYCERCRMRGILWPVVWFTMGVLFLMDNLHGPDIERTWPLFLLVVGAVKLLQSNASDAGHLGGPPVIPPPETGVAPPPPPPEAPVNQEQASSEVNHG
jgi:hypothetical protein